MKKMGMIKKFGVSMLIMMFWVQPLIQLFMHTGEVEAYTEYVTYGINSKFPGYLAPNQTLLGYRVEYRYTIKYQGYQNRVKLWEEDVKKELQPGTGFYNSNSNLGNRVYIEDIHYQTAAGKEKKPNQNIKKAVNLYGVYLKATYKETGWSLTEKKCSDFPMINAIAHNGQINTEMRPSVILNKEVKKTWMVITKTNNSNLPQNTNKNPNSPSGTGNTNTGATGLKDKLTNDLNNKKQLPTTVPSSGAPKPSNISGGNTSTGSNTIVIDRSDLSDNARRLYIRNLYKNVLRREPSNAEIASHFNKTSQKAATDIIFSTESNNKNKINSMTNSQFVDECYKYILGRTADEGGKAVWVKYLSNGNSRNSVVNEFVRSKEFKNSYNIATSTLTFNDKTCTAVYEALRNDGYSIIKPTNTTILMYTKDIEKIQSLNLNGKSITDLSGLSVFKNLKKLSASNNKIQDLSKISSLKNLEEVVLNNNSLKKLTGIENLTKVKNLNVSNNQLTEISELSKLTSLSVVNLNNNQITDLNVIKNISTLREVYADNNNIKNTPAFGGVSKISMKNNKVTMNINNGEIDVTELLKCVMDKNSKLYTANNLECTSCRIVNNKIIMDDQYATVTVKGGSADGSIVSIKNQTAVIVLNDGVLAEKLKKEFNLSEVKKDNGKYILFITNEAISTKKAIDLSSKVNDNKITDLTGLEEIFNLTNINLRNNNVTDFTPLAQMKNLQTLDVRSNGVTNFSTLKNLTQLKQIDASANDITDINGVENLTQLQDLLLSYNNIGNNIQPISKLKNLSTVALNSNGITDISGLEGLVVDELYLNRNGISDISKLKKENIGKVFIQNNNVVIDVNGSGDELPSVVKKAIENDGGVSNVECTGCSIKDNKFYFDEGIKLAQIKIKAGELCDTVVTIQDVEVMSAPNLKFEYELSEDKTEIYAKIISDKKIKTIVPWTLDETGKVLTRTFKCDIENQNITVSDLYGNEASIIINCSGIINQYIPKLTINYSETKLTNKSVDITLTSDEELYEHSGWQHVDGNVNTLRKTFDENQTLNYVDVMSKRIHDIHGQPRLVDYEISNIDKTKPICKVEYSTENVIKGAVKVTIWSDEEIETVNAISTKVVAIDKDGNKKYGSVLYYHQNANELVSVRDSAYNPSLVPVKIDNIDTKVDGAYTKMNATNLTSQNVTVTLGANEKIRVSGIEEASVIAKLKTMENSNIKNASMVADIVMLDSGVHSYNERMYKIAETTNKNEDKFGEIEIDFTEDEMGVLVLEDDVDNQDFAMINTSVIDKREINVIREDSFNEDGSVTVSLKVNKPIILTEKLVGWDISDDLQTLTQTFKQNGSLDLELEDSVGNTLIYTVTVDSIEKFDYVIYYLPVEGTDQVIVIIECERELQEIDGWTLSEEKKQLGKIMGLDETELVTIYDENGNSAEVEIHTPIENKEENNAENEETKENEEVIDNTQSPEILPQTGHYILFSLFASLIFIAISVGAYIKMKKF